MYLVEYAHHFKLNDRIRLGAVVSKMTRNNEQCKWLVHVQGKSVPEPFDKVVVAVGINKRPNMPVVAGHGVVWGPLHTLSRLQAVRLPSVPRPFQLSAPFLPLD